MYRDIVNATTMLRLETVHISAMAWDAYDYEEDTSRFDEALDAIDGELVSLKAEEIRRNTENTIIAEENYLLGYSRRR